jgi:hypothetical protein
LRKFTQFLKVAKAFAEPKNVIISPINPLLKLEDTNNRPCFETAYLVKNVKINKQIDKSK